MTSMQVGTYTTIVIGTVSRYVQSFDCFPIKLYIARLGFKFVFSLMRILLLIRRGINLKGRWLDDAILFMDFLHV